MTTILAYWIAMAWFGGQITSATAPWVMVKDAAGRAQTSFMVQSQPFKAGMTPSVTERHTARDREGRNVRGFAYYAWTTGTSIRVLVLAHVPAGQARHGSFSSQGSDMAYEQVANFRLRVGENRQVRELTAFGGDAKIVEILAKPSQ